MGNTIKRNKAENWFMLPSFRRYKILTFLQNSLVPLYLKLPLLATARWETQNKKCVNLENKKENNYAVPKCPIW